jgi:hypothetical protein
MKHFEKENTRFSETLTLANIPFCKMPHVILIFFHDTQ